ncbi:hypothetical protein CAPTEDRAFT_213990 [Capitella teleta]|uniref:Carbohydrate sulfotransferase n=1 Tax=Capitella teleta TaxID=283909 RepID=R7TN42_CAPTE|nr:hypothetical protein CAPTEDRAFT_213990 [Capitella teleta]|eukprot:ELT95278.1 hypothetical protein CAPTEDRAFT_213990 [Capitella teleta]
MSDHAPIFLTLDVPSSSKTCDRVSVSKGVSWNRATDTDILAYKETLRIILALEIAASRCIPHRRKKGLAGWSTLVNPLKEDAIFWNKIWMDCGRANSGWVYNIRRKTRAKYRQAVRFVLNNQDKLSAERMAQALDRNASRDLWQEEMKQLCFDVDREASLICGMGKCSSKHHFTALDVRKAVKKLKGGKSDARPSISSDNFIKACDELCVHLSLFLSALLTSSLAPPAMLESVLVPIPKSRKKYHNMERPRQNNEQSHVELLKVLCGPRNYSKEMVVTNFTSFFADNKHRILLCALPKTETTSWKYFLVRFASGDDHMQCNVSMHNDRNIKKHGILPVKHGRLRHQYFSYYKILQVRHPFTRLISAYKDKVHSSAGEPGKTTEHYMNELPEDVLSKLKMMFKSDMELFGMKLTVIEDSALDMKFTMKMAKNAVVDYVGFRLWDFQEKEISLICIFVPRLLELEVRCPDTLTNEINTLIRQKCEKQTYMVSISLIFYSVITV